MKVKELIEELKKYDGELDVGFEDCDGGGLYGKYERDIEVKQVKDDGDDLVVITLQSIVW